MAKKPKQIIGRNKVFGPIVLDKPPKKIEWGIARKNIESMAKKYPNILLDCIDSAYLSGLEATKKEAIQQERDSFDKVLEGLRKEIERLRPPKDFEFNHDQAEQIYDQALSEVIKALTKAQKRIKKLLKRRKIWKIIQKN